MVLSPDEGQSSERCSSVVLCCVVCVCVCVRACCRCLGTLPMKFHCGVTIVRSGFTSSTNPKDFMKLCLPRPPYNPSSSFIFKSIISPHVLGTLLCNSIIYLQEGINLLRPFFTCNPAQFTPRVRRHYPRPPKTKLGQKIQHFIAAPYAASRNRRPLLPTEAEEEAHPIIYSSSPW